MRPTVGRILHYTYAQHDGVKENKVGEVRPCVVTRVWSDTCCNITVLTDGDSDFEDGRLFQRKTSVMIVESPAEGQMTWPPRA